VRVLTTPLQECVCVLGGGLCAVLMYRIVQCGAEVQVHVSTIFSENCRKFLFAGGRKGLTLQTNKHRQYTHDAILLLQKGIQQVLISQFNPSNWGKGVEKLLDNGNNLLMLVKLADAITAGSVIKAVKK
jgi:hypothetical protein